LYQAFEALKLTSSWVGHYAYNTLDQNAIVGAHDRVANFIYANGFSGHGVQQSPAVGRAVSELVCDSKFTTLDLTKLGYARLRKREALVEPNVV
jgi:glycine/D-amino acid oxidase-like deaminating enzyme